MFIKTELRKNILLFLITGSVSVCYVLLMYFLTQWNLSDIFILPGALCLGYVGLRMIARVGIFDVFGYQITNWTTSWKKGSPKKYQDAWEYKNHMKEQREIHKMTWIPFVFIGVVFLSLCIIFSFYPQIGR